MLTESKTYYLRKATQAFGTEVFILGVYDVHPVRTLAGYVPVRRV